MDEQEAFFQEDFVIVAGNDNISSSIELNHGKRQSLDLNNALIQNVQETNPLLKITPKQGHGRKCVIIGIIFAVVIFLLSIGCFVTAGLNKKYTTSKVQQTPISFYIAPLSVTEIDLNSYGIDVHKNKGIKITALYIRDVHYSGNLEVAFQNGDIHCTTKQFQIPNAPFSHNNLLVRYWPHRQVPTGTIKCNTNDNHLWIWSGSLRNLTRFNCNSEDLSKQLNFTCSQNIQDVSDIADKVWANAREDEDLVAMLFCSKSESYVTVSINIVECLSLPTNSYKKIEVDGHTNPTNNFMIVNFNNDIFAKHPKVYIDTNGLKNFQNNYDIIEIQVTGIRNEIYWKILVGVGFFLIISVILFCICILVCFCCRKK